MKSLILILFLFPAYSLAKDSVGIDKTVDFLIKSFSYESKEVTSGFIHEGRSTNIHNFSKTVASYKEGGYFEITDTGREEIRYISDNSLRSTTKGSSKTFFNVKNINFGTVFNEVYDPVRIWCENDRHCISVKYYKNGLQSDSSEHKFIVLHLDDNDDWNALTRAKNGISYLQGLLREKAKESKNSANNDKDDEDKEIKDFFQNLK